MTSFAQQIRDKEEEIDNLAREMRDAREDYFYAQSVLENAECELQDLIEQEQEFWQNNEEGDDE